MINSTYDRVKAKIKFKTNLSKIYLGSRYLLISKARYIATA